MQAMSTQAQAQLEIDPALVGTLELEGISVPYTNLEDAPLAPSLLRVGTTGYSYQRSFPISGHSAVMPAAMHELLADDKQLLVAERGERYYVYVA